MEVFCAQKAWSANLDNGMIFRKPKSGFNHEDVLFFSEI